MPSIYFLKEWILQLDTSVAIQLIILLILLILSGFFFICGDSSYDGQPDAYPCLADEGNKKRRPSCTSQMTPVKC